ncbi:MAG: HD domain-containing protein [Desulfovibrionaceae bacterium]|nr:HD domain-containing protein [Desulfovibrionaceae bacterium]
MLRQTPRTGWAYLGTNSENVAEHSFRVAVLGYILARLAGVEPDSVVRLCLFHDLHEARSGDFNYVYHRYNQTKPHAALADALLGTGFLAEIVSYFDEFSGSETQAALLANDADQLDLIANLRVELHKGNQFARDWLDSALLRLKTEEGRQLARALLEADPNNWWYGEVAKSFWVHHK